MKPTSSTKTSARKPSRRAAEDDAPPLTQKAFQSAQYRIGAKPVGRAQWQAAASARVGKQRISIMLDTPVIEHFKSVAGARGYQTLINEALRQVAQGDDFLAKMRSVIRAELSRGVS
jgi:uncharacterized protein (DUF4415 family)